MLGLLSIALTLTYLPPICSITFAYSFSAPTAEIVAPPDEEDEELAPHPTSKSTRTAAAAETAKRARAQRGAMFIGNLDLIV